MSFYKKLFDFYSFNNSIGIATASGLSATMLLTHLLKSGDHILSVDDVYGGT